MHIKILFLQEMDFLILPGITMIRVMEEYFPIVEPFGEFLFDLLDDSKSAKEDYKIDNSFNVNQQKYVFKEMYSLTKAAALEFTEKNKFCSKGDINQRRRWN